MALGEIGEFQKEPLADDCWYRFKKGFGPNPNRRSEPRGAYGCRAQMDSQAS